MKMVHDEAVADDIVQEVFVYYFEKTANGHQIENVQGWLARATMNKCVDHLKYRERFIKLNTVSEPTIEEESFEINKTDSILKQALSKLKPLEMKIVILYSEEYSYKEIAQIVKINFSSVGKTLSRTLQKLKEILKKMNYEMY
jgi:RNA polymerase sigma-70 factor (ECF subfamily)